MSPFDLPSRRAIALLSSNQVAALSLRFCPPEGLEIHARATLANVERELRSAVKRVTIRTLWVKLAERAVEGGEPDVRAAAALTGMAMGLQAS